MSISTCESVIRSSYVAASDNGWGRTCHGTSLRRRKIVWTPPERPQGVCSTLRNHCTSAVLRAVRRNSSRTRAAASKRVLCIGEPRWNDRDGETALPPRRPTRSGVNTCDERNKTSTSSPLLLSLRGVCPAYCTRDAIYRSTSSSPSTSMRGGTSRAQ